MREDGGLRIDHPGRDSLSSIFYPQTISVSVSLWHGLNKLERRRDMIYAPSSIMFSH
jgi:hypothetical protein